MDNKKFTISDEELEQVVETLESSKSENSNVLADIIKSDTPKEELETAEINVAVDPESGEQTNLGFAQRIMDEYDITLDDINNVDTSDFENMKITKDMILNSDLNKDNEITDAQVIELLSFFEKYDSREKISLYNEMPSFMKEMVDKIYADGRGQLKKSEIAKIITDQMIGEIKMDQAFLDLNEAIKNELKIPSLSDLYTEFIKENFEEKLLEVANQVEAENPEKAKMLREVSESYKLTYTFELMREALKNRKTRQFIKDTSKYKKMCKKFNDKYINSRFKISSVDMCYGAIKSAMPELDDEYNKKFIMLFCKSCDMLNPDNINDHVIMYYTIQNIRLLQHEESILEGTEATRSDMYNTVIENIKKTVEEIKKFEAKTTNK